MNKVYRVIAVAVICVTFCGLFSGCFDAREVDELTYAIAIGLDIGKQYPLKMTVQYAIPTAMGGGGRKSSGGGGNEGGASESKSTGLITVETQSIFSGLNMINNSIGKQINISHAVVVIFSEEMAKNGHLIDYMHALSREKEFRPNMYVAVARGSAEDYIKSIKPIQEINPAKYYELKFATYNYTGFTANTQLSSFYNEMQSSTKQPIATLVGVNSSENSDDISNSESTYREKNRETPMFGDYKAGDTPQTGDIKGETMGLAVFDGMKMVGELDGQEALMYLIASGNYNHSFITIPDPENKNLNVNLRLRQSRKPSCRVQFVNGKPKILIKIMLEGDFTSIQSGVNYEEGPKLAKFETAAEQYMKDEMMRFLNRTKDMHSDICGFGDYAKIKFLNWNDWKRYNWLGMYSEAAFDIDLDLKVRRTGLMTRSLHAISSAGEVY